MNSLQVIDVLEWEDWEDWEDAFIYRLFSVFPAKKWTGKIGKITHAALIISSQSSQWEERLGRRSKPRQYWVLPNLPSLPSEIIKLGEKAMASFNKIIIVGYLGRDPELKNTPQGNAVCKFSVATTERRKGADGEPEEITSWFRVTAWNQTAEFVGQHLGKGQQVYVEGRLRAEEWTDREGQRRTNLEVNANAVQLLGKLIDEAEPQRPQTKAATAGIDKAASRAALKAQGPAGFDEDDIPF